MGAMRAMDIADTLDVEQGVRVHLTTNHYPAVPIEMVPVCIDAIDAVNSGALLGSVYYHQMYQTVI